MPTETRLNTDERRKYLLIMKEQYDHAASRAERSKLLKTMVTYTGMHRKSVIRLLHGDLARRRRQRQRGPTYGSGVQQAVLLIAESLDFVCPERLTPSLVSMAQHLAKHGELELSPALLQALGEISISSVRRMMQRSGQHSARLLPRRGRSALAEALRDVPMKRIPWDEVTPGHMEVDLVHHCGHSATGDYVYTLQMIDVTTGWSERRAILGRSGLVMQDAFRYLLSRLPFTLLELHSDNGAEFFNAHLRRFWQETLPTLHLSRSRPYQKNDNRFVEQRNFTWVRAYLGYGRFDTVAQALAINQLYDKLWLYDNFFQPVMRLLEKDQVTTAQGEPRLRRRHDQAQTPFARLCATEAISPERKEQLQQLRQQTNPRTLREEIYALLNYIATLPPAVPGQVEDVFQTLVATPTWQKGEGSSVTLSFDGTLPSRNLPAHPDPTFGNIII